MPIVKLNEIFILPRGSETNTAIRADLYDIESNNTKEVRTQSASTATGNEHTIQKSSNEAFIATNIAGGTLEFVTDNSSAELVPAQFLFITFVQEEE